MLRSALPFELIQIILELAYQKSDGHADYNTLTACSLVCKTWSPVARKLMLLEVTVPPLSNPFIRSVQSGAHVRLLGVPVRTPGDWEDFRSVLSHCPNIHQLNISSSDPSPYFTPSVFSRLNNIRAPVQALHVGDYFSAYDIDLQAP